MIVVGLAQQENTAELSHNSIVEITIKFFRILGVIL